MQDLVGLIPTESSVELFSLRHSESNYENYKQNYENASSLVRWRHIQGLEFLPTLWQYMLLIDKFPKIMTSNDRPLVFITIFVSVNMFLSTGTHLQCYPISSSLVPVGYCWICLLQIPNSLPMIFLSSGWVYLVWFGYNPSIMLTSVYI